MINYKAAFWTLLVLVLAAGAVGWKAYSTAMKERQEKIAQVTRERDAALQENASIKAHAAELEANIQRLQSERTELKGQVDQKLEEITRLQSDLDTARKNAFQVVDRAELKARINKQYPEMAKSNWDIIKAKNPETGLWEENLKIPVGMASVFLFRDVESGNLEQQNRKLTDVVGLKSRIIDLQDQVNTLTKAQAELYQKAYDKAFDSYMASTKDLIDTLKQPAFKMNVPRLPVLIGCTALGYFLGHY